VAVVGSGPGGAIAAAVLAAAGCSVVVLEEGGLSTRADFDMREATAYPRLYQDGGRRATDDLSILVLQGRSVGGGSTVNWMTCYRTPARTLDYWERRCGVVGVNEEVLGPLWDSIENRLGVHVAEESDVNRNNRVLWEGCQRLGYGVERLARNSDGCTNLGYCGMGCPIDAKRDARLTYLDDAMSSGAEVFSNCRVELLVTEGSRVREVRASVLNPETGEPVGRPLTVRPKVAVLAGGALNTPALLHRSRLLHPEGMLGRGTWLHPVVAMAAEFPEEIAPFSGSPQSVGCRHFVERGARMGFFIEAPPVHPMLAALAFPAFGREHAQFLSRLSRTNVLIGLAVDGFSEEERGGTVRPRPDKGVRLRYPLTERHRETLVEAMKEMARIQFAAGAQRVISLHSPPVELRSASDLPRLEEAPFGPNRLSLFSAHPMGGCPMGEDPRRSVVNSRGRHHRFENLHIADGSVFPTSVGVNPMISIYGISRLFAEGIARRG
jgi:choline dehydrogenase-like flavoprotein